MNRFVIELHAIPLHIVPLLAFTNYSLGFVILSPSNVAQVCAGQQFELTCTTNESFLVWNFVPPLKNDQGVSIPQDWFISSDDLSEQRQVLTVNSTSFSFVRTSTRHSSPLMTSLTIINTSNALNEIAINCTEILNNIKLGMATSTSFNIIGNTHAGIDEYDLRIQGSPSALEVNIGTDFEADSVSVILEWMPEEGVLYSVAVDRAVAFRYIHRTSVNLTVLYNAPSNVTITATSCGHNSATTVTLVELNYDRCEDPLQSVADESVRVVGYHNLAVNGTVITFSCPSGMKLNGPSTVMCTHTGHWEPDPKGVNCSEDVTISNITQCEIPSPPTNDYVINIPYNTTNKTVSVTFFCPNPNNCGGELRSYFELHTAVCTLNGDVEINPLDINSSSRVDSNLTVVVASSAAAVFLVSAVLIFIIGFVSGHSYGQKHKRPVNQTCQGLDSPIIPAYESIHQEQAFELKENVAYGPSISTIS